LKIIIIGAGEVGFHIASRLALENKDVVVIDKNSSSIQRVSDQLDVQTIEGSGSNPVVLEQAGIREAEILLAVTDSDEINLVACLVANVMSPSTKKLARLRDAGYDEYHEVFREKAPHIDTIINPEIEVVKSIERMLSVPGAVDVAEFEGGKIKFIGVLLDENARPAGARLTELASIFGENRPLVTAIIRKEELIIPTGDDYLMPNDIVYFISRDDKLMETLRMFGKQHEALKRVLIVGGGRIGFRLAKELEAKAVYTKIIEADEKRCTDLAEQLNKTVVLHGDGSDQEILREENIQEMDAVVTVTDNEETNILVSLLCKRMGVGKGITKISRFSYFHLLSTIGVNLIVSPRLSAINTILQHIRRGKILSAVSIKGEQAEVIEAMAMETSDIVDKPLKRLSFPKDALLAAIIRKQDIIIPSGESVVKPGDRIIIFAKRNVVPKIEKFLMVKLEFF